MELEKKEGKRKKEEGRNKSKHFLRNAAQTAVSYQLSATTFSLLSKLY
ncbi:MAG: hypothetical protein F6K48_29675 [Okeania sp. SIO3H1]|nr:hypothetical protein [Okeania sp. SIO3H1]